MLHAVSVAVGLLVVSVNFLLSEDEASVQVTDLIKFFDLFSISAALMAIAQGVQL